jgi:hypothetical protein
MLHGFSPPKTSSGPAILTQMSDPATALTFCRDLGLQRCRRRSAADEDAVLFKSVEGDGVGEPSRKDRVEFGKACRIDVDGRDMPGFR